MISYDGGWAVEKLFTIEMFLKRNINHFPFTSCFKTGLLENEIEVALPTAELKELAPGVSLLPPLTRSGYGPGLIIMLPNGTPGNCHTKKAEHYAKMESLHHF